MDKLCYEDKAESGDLKTRYLMKQLSKLREKLKSFVEQDVNVQKIDSRSRVLFPLTFFVINLIFWMYFIIVTSKWDCYQSHYFDNFTSLAMVVQCSEEYWSNC